MAESNKVYIQGNTFPVKEQLKQLGCKWDGDRRAWFAPSADIATQAQAVVKPHPIYNSPPPADLGTTDPVELATKFGRTAVAGAAVKSFTGHGKPAEPNGRVVRIRGARYVQVAHATPRYFSRDMLEDFDMFGEAAGYQYQWDGVEVEPTDAERAADQAEIDAKTARTTAVATLKAAAERVRKQGEYPTGEVTLPHERGTEKIAADKGSAWSGPRGHFIIAPDWIWHTLYNGADGDDWSCNNVSGLIVHRLPFDAEFAASIRSAAKLLGYEVKIEPGEPARTRIETPQGAVYQNGWRSAEVRISWTPPEPLLGCHELTSGHPATIDGVAVVEFSEVVKKNGKNHKVCPKIEGRPELAELVRLANELQGELKAHYGKDAD